jgi:hypothetical protein
MCCMIFCNIVQNVENLKASLMKCTREMAKQNGWTLYGTSTLDVATAKKQRVRQ